MTRMVQPATLRALHIPNVSASLFASADLAETMGPHPSAVEYRRLAVEARKHGPELYRHWAGEAEERLERIRCERREG